MSGGVCLIGVDFRPVLLPSSLHRMPFTIPSSAAIQLLRVFEGKRFKPKALLQTQWDNVRGTKLSIFSFQRPFWSPASLHPIQGWTKTPADIRRRPLPTTPPTMTSSWSDATVRPFCSIRHPTGIRPSSNHRIIRIIIRLLPGKKMIRYLMIGY